MLLKGRNLRAQALPLPPKRNLIPRTQQESTATQLLVSGAIYLPDTAPGLLHHQLVHHRLQADAHHNSLRGEAQSD